MKKIDEVNLPIQENWKFSAGTQFKINFAKIRYANRYCIMLSLFVALATLSP